MIASHNRLISSQAMPTWVVVRNNSLAWAAVDRAALQQYFVRYGPILELEIFDGGSKTSILFKNQVDAEKMVEELTFAWHGPCYFIPGMSYSRLGAYIRPSRNRVSCDLNSFFFRF